MYPDRPARIHAPLQIPIRLSLIRAWSMNASESSAYYQPPSIFTFSVVTPVRQDPNEPASTLSRICSVRGCSFVIEAASTNKMCLACRGKHRIYASTKRTRRKLEKAAVQGQTIMPVEQIPGSAAWMPGAIAPDPEQEPKKQVNSVAVCRDIVHYYVTG